LININKIKMSEIIGDNKEEQQLPVTNLNQPEEFP
jgi:hypothetical protein